MSQPDFYSTVIFNGNRDETLAEVRRAAKLMHENGATWLLYQIDESNPEWLDIGGWKVRPEPPPSSFHPLRTRVSSGAS
jgi:hypothetical protein